MEIKIKVEEIAYGDLAVKMLPLIGEHFAGEAGPAAKMLEKLSHMPPSFARAMVDALPKSKKDELTAELINRKKDYIMDAVEQYAIKNGVEIHVTDLNADTKYF